MSTQIEPEVGNWYHGPDENPFEVVAYDETAGVVGVQYFDGDIEELDLEVWYDSEFIPREPPEDWSGPFDDLERDDFGDTETPVHHDDWNNPIDTIE